MRKEIMVEVYPNNLGRMDWDEAVKVCGELGDGWRLPTKSELNYLYENKDKIGGFKKEYYWSSTEFDDDSSWDQGFYSGFQFHHLKSSISNVRAVRDI